MTDARLARTVGALEGHVLALSAVAGTDASRLRGAAHQLRTAGLDDIAATLERHADVLAGVCGDIERELAALVVLTDPTLDATRPL